MSSRAALLLLALAAPLAAAAAPPAKPAAAKPATPVHQVSPSKHKLKPGADGQLCLGCHVKLEAELRKASVHTPVKARQCAGCHNPHASQHAKLLADEPDRACLRCHGAVLPASPKSAHAPAAKGDCAACHVAHASDNPNVLKQPVGALCASCHGAVAKAAAGAKIKHRPLETTGCTACHDPHGSAAAGALLVKDEPALCVGCHKTDRPIFAKQHMGYPVAGSRCTSCHDPHGSSTKGMLYDNVHGPVAKGMCNQCHAAPGAAPVAAGASAGGGALATDKAALATKDRGTALCVRCHEQIVGAMLEKGHVHRPVMEGDACLTCHAPHASKQKKLVAGEAVAICGGCHADTIKRHDRSPTKHPPVGEGNCTACHDPHGSDNPLMFAKASVAETCGKCHDWQKHSTHPIGDKVIDPRNPNKRVECLSCHRAHGTEFKRLMPYAVVSDLCTKCHEQYKR